MYFDLLYKKYTWPPTQVQLGVEVELNVNKNVIIIYRM